MISLKEFQKKIEESEEFKQFKEKTPDAILANAFTMLKDWQLDYYSKITDRITSFTIEDNKITLKESEIFRKRKQEIFPLNLDIKIPIEQAIEKTEIKNAQKTIAVLQIIEKKQIWNITLITSSFKTINIKIDANSGEIISKQETSLLSNIKLGDLIKK